MLSIHQLDFGHGSHAIFRNASLVVKPKNKIGVIGKNGAGKSTLLKLLTGDLSPEGGNIESPKDFKISYFSQELLELKLDFTALEWVARGKELYFNLESKISNLQNQDGKDPLKIAELQAHLYELKDPKIEAGQLLNGLGFSKEEMNSQLSTLSGGRRMRALLARSVFTDPDLLLLDEPTNHLDLPSIMWFEEFLKKTSCAMLLVSHDTEFINSCCDHILEVSGNNLNLFTGNYLAFLKRKKEDAELLERKYKNQQSKLKQEEKFIERFRYKASKAKAVQSRIKLLEKTDRIELEDQDGYRGPRIKFDKVIRSGKIAFQLNNVCKSYGDKEIFCSEAFEGERGDRIAIIGANGIGKSTLLKIIDQQIDFNGELIIGHNVSISFFAQHQLEQLNPESDVFKQILNDLSFLTEQEARNLLGSFMFSGEDTQKKVKVLSGGERTRLALAICVGSKANLLLLDEPTNHLDIQAISNLENALVEYPGTMAFVSHNRDFIRKLSTKVLYIENKKLKYYPGPFSDFENTSQYAEILSLNKTVLGKKGKSVKKGVSKQDYKEQKEYARKLRQVQNKFSNTEKNIDDCNKRITALEFEMNQSNNLSDSVIMDQLLKKYNLEKKYKGDLEREWEKYFELIEELENN